MKFCKSCQLNKEESKFVKKGAGFSARCKLCINSRMRELYKGNKQRIKQVYSAVKTRRLKIRAEIDKLKDRPCTDCGIKYNSWQMDFDHLPDTLKVNNITRLVALGWSIEKIKEEIAKCELVCANCHRQRTYDRGATVAQSLDR